MKESCIPDAGYGLFTSQAIEADKCVGTYTGRVTLSSKPKEGDRMLELFEGVNTDGGRSGNSIKFSIHASTGYEANCKMYLCKYNGYHYACLSQRLVLTLVLSCYGITATNFEEKEAKNSTKLPAPWDALDQGSFMRISEPPTSVVNC